MTPLTIADLSILYVEDDKSIRDVYTEQLQTCVKNVYGAANGEEGYLQFKDKHPDVIITDIMMPVLDGIDMAKKIRQDDEFTPIVITSSSSDTKHLHKTLDIGIHGYMSKPINFNDLIDLLKSICKILQLDDEKKIHEKILKDRFNMQRLLV